VDPCSEKFRGCTNFHLISRWRARGKIPPISTIGEPL
jgi:hypothetical protein